MSEQIEATARAEEAARLCDAQYDEVASLAEKLEALRAEMTNTVGPDFEKLAAEYDRLITTNRFLPTKVGAAAKTKAVAELIALREQHTTAVAAYNAAVTEYNVLDAEVKALVRKYGKITDGRPTSTPEFDEKSAPVRERMAELKPQIGKLTQRLGILRISLKKYTGSNDGYDPSWDLSEKRIDQLANQHGVVWQSIAAKRLLMAVGKNPNRDSWM